MKKIETYNIMIDMKSLRKAARKSENYTYALHNLFYYNPLTGEILCATDLTQNEYTVIEGFYHFCDSAKHMTQQAIVDKLRERIEEIWWLDEGR